MANRRFGPVGIIDIGSNSVRFVAYGGTARVPSALFNEKVMAALGRGVEKDGRLAEQAMALTLDALGRFQLLAREMGLKKVHTVATAAVREASNSEDFLGRVRRLGLKPRLLSGPEEAVLAGLGVLSAIPDASGIVADLGGGSLELIPVGDGATGAGISLPLGVLRIGDRADPAKLAATIRAAIQDSALGGMKAPRLYLVGGSFRALANLDLKLLSHPLPIVHQHQLRPERLAELRRLLLAKDTAANLSSPRLKDLPAASAVVAALAEALAPRRVIVSAFGLREGLLYRDLDAATRALDPLLAAALEVGERLGRFGDHGAAIDAWMDPLFPDDGPDHRRLRLAACLLGDIAWNAHPDFRAERAVDMAIHGNWVAIDARGRALVGRALCSALGNSGGFSAQLGALLGPGELERGEAWGRALRLAQRLSGGTEGLLNRSRIALAPGKVVLTIARGFAELHSDAVERRLRQLAKCLGREAELLFA